MDHPTNFMDMFGLHDTSTHDVQKKVPNINRTLSKPVPEIESDSDSEQEIDLDYIIDECPKTAVAREFMKAQIKNIDEPSWL